MVTSFTVPPFRHPTVDLILLCKLNTYFSFIPCVLFHHLPYNAMDFYFSVSECVSPTYAAGDGDYQGIDCH